MLTSITRPCEKGPRSLIRTITLSPFEVLVTRTMLLENVWDYHFDPKTNIVETHISRLRSKIDKGQDKPLLHTIRGAGYMIRDGIR